MVNNKNNSKDNSKDIDQLSGVETTGHEWDGIKELNLPAPRWWLIVFILCCIWAFGYWVVYPAWPTLTGNTKGVSGWTKYKKLSKDQAEINNIRGKYLKQINEKSLEDIKKDPELYAFAVSGGKASFKDNCAACHGTGAEGGKGFPNLNDDDWLWGGKLEDIYATILNGVRSSAEKTRSSQMPAFGRDGLLNNKQIEQVAEYVLSLSGGKVATLEGEQIFKQNCSSCHGDDGKGNPEFGAPNLTDNIWLYNSDKISIEEQISNPHLGIMPTWEGRLPDATIKELTIYVHSLGGGKR